MLNTSGVDGLPHLLCSFACKYGGNNGFQVQINSEENFQSSYAQLFKQTSIAFMFMSICTGSDCRCMQPANKNDIIWFIWPATRKQCAY